MSDSESRSDGGLGAARKAPAVEATVPPTAGELLAQWMQEVIDAERKLKRKQHWKNRHWVEYGMLVMQRDNLRRVLDANHAST